MYSMSYASDTTVTMKIIAIYLDPHFHTLPYRLDKINIHKLMESQRNDYLFDLYKRTVKNRP